MIDKELKEYWKAEKALRVKIFEYLDNQDKMVNFWLQQDRVSYEIHFVGIKDKYLIADNNEMWDYKAFNTGELLEVYENVSES